MMSVSFAVEEEPNNVMLKSTSEMSDGMWSPWKLLVDVDTREHGLGFYSSATEDVDHDTLWQTLLNEVRQPGALRRRVRVRKLEGYSAHDQSKWMT